MDSATTAHGKLDVLVQSLGAETKRIIVYD
jgi:hypothetical protein